MQMLPTLIPATPFGIADVHLTSSNVTEADYAAWASGTTYAAGDRAIIVSPSNTATFTIASPCVMTWAANKALPENTPISFSTTGALPTGLTAGRIYFTRNWVTASATCNLALTPDGAPINTTGSQSGTHTGNATRHDVYESLVGSNTGNHPATSPNHWFRVDSTNRWRMHDNSMGTQTANAGSIANVYEATQIIDAVALMNISAASVRVTVTDATDGLVFDETVSGIAPPSVSSFYAWGFEPIVRVTDMLITGMPPYINAAIGITLTDTGGTALCGNCVMALIRDFGGTAYGMSMRIDDYSVKERSAQGIYTIVEGDYSRRMTGMVYVEAGQVPAVFNLLASFRAIPAVYIGSSLYGPSFIFGFLTTYDIVVDFPTQSLLKIEAESLI